MRLFAWSIVATAMFACLGCDKHTEADADADPEYDVMGDILPDMVDGPDVPAETTYDPAVDLPVEVVEETPEDAASDVPGDSATDGSSSCVCGGPGVWLEADAGCSSWPDATECTGWHSVIDPDGDGSPAVTDLFGDLAQFCTYGCCITIHCP